MTQFVTRGFHHVTMVSADAQRTLTFYRDLLGLSLVKKTVNFDVPETYHLYFGDSSGRPGSLLTLFEWPRAARGRFGVGGIHHIALGVSIETVQLKWKRRLTDNGVRVGGPYDRGYFCSIYFTDPDGQVLEMATEGPGFAIDEPADALGQELKIPDSRRLPRGRDEARIAAETYPEPVPEITPDMEIAGIHHVTGHTDDLDQSHEFYTNALGLRLVKKSLNQDDEKTLHYFWANYDGQRVAPSSDITLFGWPERSPNAREGTGQTHHVAYRAKDDAQQLEWREHLESLGLHVTDVKDRKYFKSIYFRTHDGLLVEIATDGPGFAVDEHASSLGSTLCLPDWLEPRRAEIEADLRPIV
ncbi:ring-cleaving dioxygenase [soil metagenome]